MQRRIQQLEEATSSLSSDVADGTANLPPLQKAQAMCAEMKAILALGETLHNLEGEDSSALESSKTALAAYEKKVWAAVAKQELGRKKRGMQINIDAAHRFITNALPDLSEQAKSELKQARRRCYASFRSGAHELV